MLYAVAMLASVALVLVNAFFVAAEFAIVKIRPSRLEQLAAQGHRRARVALGIARRLDAYLSANQLGITLASLALGWIGEPAFAGLLKPLFASFGAWSVPTAHAVAVMASFAAITFSIPSWANWLRSPWPSSARNQWRCGRPRRCASSTW